MNEKQLIEKVKQSIWQDIFIAIQIAIVLLFAASGLIFWMLYLSGSLIFYSSCLDKFY